MTTPTKPTRTPPTSLMKAPLPPPSALKGVEPETLAARIGKFEAGQDARLQVGQALVELVVAQGGDIQGHRVKRLHGGAVLEDGGDVGRSTHGVSAETNSVLGLAARAEETSQASVTAPGSSTDVCPVPLSVCVVREMWPCRSVMPSRSMVVVPLAGASAGVAGSSAPAVGVSGKGLRAVRVSAHMTAPTLTATWGAVACRSLS